jgi:hypothetical protein
MTARHVTGAALLVAAAIHLLPLSGVAGGPALERLYGVAVDDPTVQLLLRHRAVLFGLLGVALASAAFVPRWHGAALGAAMVSVLSFLGLAQGVDGLHAAIGRVVVADLVALGALGIGAAAWAIAGRTAARRAVDRS